MNKTHIGDCRELLKEMAADDVRVQTCITSPPYFGLRDYQTGTWEGGDAECDHLEVGPQGRAGRETPGGRGGSFPHTDRAYKALCRKCGALRIDQQLGLESTPEEYVSELVSVFRAVRDVLADDGTLWLNLGDSYAGGKLGRADNGRTVQGRILGWVEYDMGAAKGRSPPAGFKPKDLLGIPWRVAFALQSDGWYLRSDIIWHKPNPMPESVTDRPTKAHEYLFLLAKSERYYYDAEAIKEPSVDPESYTGRKPRSPDKREGDPFFATKVGNHAEGKLYELRNRRSVWSIATTPFSGAHFATFPRALIEPCVIAGARPNDTVLDPFMGSGTTGQVATDLGRNFIGCELNPKYIELNEMRRTTIGMSF
jgi:DNA modification methylase